MFGDVDGFYSTGAASHLLGVSQARLRALCAAGAVESQRTGGGQLRISCAELERIQHIGLPTLPRPLPDASAPARTSKENGHSGLLARPSNEVVAAAELVAIAQSQLERRRVERELCETEAWFSEREAEQAARAAESQHESGRLDWLREAEEYALSRIHPQVPAEMRLAALEAVHTSLGPLQPAPSTQVTKEIVQGVLEVHLGAWLRLGDVLALAEGMRQSALLPWYIRAEEASRWQDAAVKAAVPAMVDILGGDVNASIPALRAAGTAAAQAVLDGLRHARRCEKLVADPWWLRLPPDLSVEDRAEATAAVARTLQEQPPASSDRDLEQVRDRVLEPFRDAAAKARAEEHAKLVDEFRKIRRGEP